MKGHIGYYKLTDWWQSAFTDAERAHIENIFHPMGDPNPRPLTQGRGVGDWPAAQFLFILADWFKKADDKHLGERMREKGAALARQFPSTEPGCYQGRHFTTYVEEVKQLKREGRLEEAETLLLGLIDATEAEAQASNGTPAPWYYEHLGIVYRKMKKPHEAEMVAARLEKRVPREKVKEMIAALPIFNTTEL